MSMETDITRSTCLWVPDEDGIWTSECNNHFFFDTDFFCESFRYTKSVDDGGLAQMQRLLQFGRELSHAL